MRYLCTNFGLPRPLCSRLGPDVHDRQTERGQSDRQTDVRQTNVSKHHHLMPLPNAQISHLGIFKYWYSGAASGKNCPVHQ